MKTKMLSIALITTHAVSANHRRVLLSSVDVRLPNTISTGATIVIYLCFSRTIVLPDKRRDSISGK